MNTIKSQLIDIKQDGSIWLNQFYFDYLGGSKMIREDRWKSIFQISERKSSDAIEQEHCNLALAIQNVTEEVILLQVKKLREISDLDKLCLSGGVALNTVAIGEVVSSKIFDQVFIMPASGDSSAAIGAAQAIYYLYYKLERTNVHQKINVHLGPKFTNEECLEQILSFDCRYQYMADRETLIEEIAQLLREGNIIGWFQGKLEFGSKGLGNRSILANPTWPGVQDRLNQKIKMNERFRSFGVAILKEEVSNYFEHDMNSPYMTYSRSLSDVWRKEVQDDFHSKTWEEKVNIPRSKFQATTDINFNTEVQIVDYFQNPLFYNLITRFFQKSGYPMLLNTPFNQRDEPLVCTPLDALRCFFSSDLDILVLENYIIKK